MVITVIQMPINEVQILPFSILNLSQFLENGCSAEFELYRPQCGAGVVMPRGKPATWKQHVKTCGPNQGRC